MIYNGFEAPATHVPYRDIVISKAEIQSTDIVSDGITCVKGVITAGKAGRERSWQLPGALDISVSIPVIPLHALR